MNHYEKLRWAVQKLILYVVLLMFGGFRIVFSSSIELFSRRTHQRRVRQNIWLRDAKIESSKCSAEGHEVRYLRKLQYIRCSSRIEREVAILEYLCIWAISAFCESQNQFVSSIYISNDIFRCNNLCTWYHVWMTAFYLYTLGCIPLPSSCGGKLKEWFRLSKWLPICIQVENIVIGRDEIRKGHSLRLLEERDFWEVEPCT